MNNNGFAKNLAQVLKPLQRHDRSGSLLTMDIDHLKRFNDNMGHPAGDKLIRTYAQVIEKQVRISDLKAREGGDEMAVLLI